MPLFSRRGITGPTPQQPDLYAGSPARGRGRQLRAAQRLRPSAPALPLQNYAEVGAEVWRTDLEGSLTFIWQNNTLNVETSADSADFAA